ncbi:MAG: IMS domain-containing protein [Candidatus Sericytochromatia bacterium]
MEKYKTCPECSKNALLEDTVCANCGYPFLPSEIIVVEKKQPTLSQKQKLIALSSVFILTLVYIGYYFYSNAPVATPEPSQNSEQVVQNAAPEPVVPTPTPDPFSKTQYASTSGVQVLTAPSLSSSVLKTLSLNDALSVSDESKTANGYTWVKVRLSDGRMGWAPSSFLTIVQTDVQERAKSAAWSHVHAHLKAPSTAELVESAVIEENHPNYLVKITVDAQNSFGAMLRSTYLVCIALGEGTTYYTNENFSTHEMDRGDNDYLSAYTASFCRTWAPKIDGFLRPPKASGGTAVSDVPTGPATITGGESSPEEKAVRDVLSRWQTVKRDAFLQGNTSELSSILSGSALTETQGGVEWWANPSNGSYRDIQLHSLNIQSISFPQSTQAIAKVSISETKDNSVQGRKTSNYSATYELTKTGESWYISGIKAD